MNGHGEAALRQIDEELEAAISNTSEGMDSHTQPKATQKLTSENPPFHTSILTSTRTPKHGRIPDPLTLSSKNLSMSIPRSGLN